MRKQKNKRWRYRLLLLIGIAILLYPSLSNLWNESMASRVIASYRATVKETDHGEEAEIMKKARRYNRALASAQEEIFLSGEEAKGYRKQLWLDENGMMGYLEIPSIRVYLPIYHGTEEAVLQKGVGHLSWTSLPIEGKSVHSVLSGHRGLPSTKLFTDLDQLREDDAFSVHILGSVLTYQVEQICVVAPTETEVLQIEPEKNYCTLMTCTPYGVNTQRLLIRGILTDTDTTQERQESREKPQSEKLPLLPVLIAGSFVLAVCLLIRKKRKGKEEIG